MAASGVIGVDEAWNALLSRKLGTENSVISFWPDGTWKASGKIDMKASDLLDLYTPFIAKRSTVTAHLGQSMDGFIATENGASHYITGSENIVHLHRMRALADAVLVGRNTVDSDDPQLTTRLVRGPNPIRIVIDPKLRLEAKHHIFTQSDTPTLILCEKKSRNKLVSYPEHVQIIDVPVCTDGLKPSACLTALKKRGVSHLFIEGGGYTISRFVNTKSVHRLQITIAPVFLGAGKRGLTVPPALKPSAAFQKNFRKYQMGDDMLYDYVLEED